MIFKLTPSMSSLTVCFNDITGFFRLISMSIDAVDCLVPSLAKY